MIEIEKTYLAKYLPSGLKNCPSTEIIDVYFPAHQHHPVIRLRKLGKRLEMTKKEPVDDDPSRQREQTIRLTQEEFDALLKVEGRKVHKIRYDYVHQGRPCQIDVFQGPLQGLVLVDVEFEGDTEKDEFPMPEFCLVEVTKDITFAGGYICGKSYADVVGVLEKHGYTTLALE